MNRPLEVLIDSDAFVGRFYPDDVHFKQVNRIFDQLEKGGKRLLTTNLVVGETATVLSHRSGQAAARLFLTALERSRLPVIHIDEKLHQETLHFFQKQTRKGTSIVDCANVIVMRRFGIATILSFDKFYTKQKGFQSPTR